VVTLEPAPRDPEGLSKVVQLVVGRVADQVAPELATKRPDGLVDQHRHAHNGAVTDCLLAARALVLHDLMACGMDSARTVSIVDDVLTERRWWVDQWPDGAAYVACLVAQDVQEALLEEVGRWPLCGLSHDEDDRPHELRVAPDLGEDPHWVCEEQGQIVAPVGALTR
jgi:hypothetical protein